MTRFLFCTLVATMFSCSPLWAQNACVHQAQLEKMHRNHPEWMGVQRQQRAALEEYSRSAPALCTNEDLLIPVVFHVVHDNGPENISDAQIHESIVQLNEDFSATNPELGDVDLNFEGLVADVGMVFRLADFDPNGQPTTGINRIQSDLTYNGSDLALKQMVQWDPTMYLNIWVVHSSDGGNGSAFAFYPGDVGGSASIYDGIVSSYWAVGRTEAAVWTHYKILTHEVGHWANLKHTWGDQSYNGSTGGCAYDDGVEDTPNTIGNTGCDIGASSCGSLDNVQNYMDYSNCSSMFTVGQKNRMLATMCSDVAGRNHIWSAENHAQVFLQEDFLPRIVYQDQTFEEHFSNSGNIDSDLGLELIDLSFDTTGDLTEGLDFTTSNLPAGTSLSVTVTDATHATVTMSGQVASHTAADNLDNLELHFTAAPFAGVALADIYNPSNTALGLSFLDPYEIVFVDLVDDAHNFFEGRRWTWFTMGSGGADWGFFHYDLVNIKLETYGNGAICHPGTRNIVPLPQGHTVGPTSQITPPGTWYPDQLDLSNPTYTDWNGQTAYAGVQFQRNGLSHYGWIRLRVSEDGRHYYALDMAYNEEPFAAIATGEVERPVLAYTQTTFHESEANEGALSSVRAIDVFGATWTTFETLQSGNGFEATNLPEGLTAQVERLSDTRIALSFHGQAADHQEQHDQSTNVSFDASLLSNVADGMSLSRSMTLDFADPYGIEYVDVDPSEGIAIANPGNNWKYFSWDVGDAEFGLWYINDHFRLETYSKSGVCNAGSTNLTALQEGDTIQTSSNWEYFSELETQLVITSPTYSDWNGQTLYAGVKFTIAERFHYGWMRFEVGADGQSVEFLDYAYNRKPGEEILAGQLYATYGCTDPLALNHNPFAIDDDGTCEYPLDCGEDNAVQVFMFDSYGDGWNGNVLEFASPDGTVLESVTLNSGSDGMTEFCLPSDCYAYSAGGGNYLNEISWELYVDSVLVASGSGGDTGLFSVNGDCSVLYGCTDPDAFNYDPDVVVDDGSCYFPVLGCTDPLALNYNAEAQEDDGSCFYEDDVLGCTEESALNYNPAATYDDGTCVYPELILTDVAPEWCMGEVMEITWTGGNPNGSVNMSLINVTANAVDASLGVMDNTGVFLWTVEGIDPNNTYRLYLEEHPYPPSDWTYGNNFNVLEDCPSDCPEDLDGDGSIATGDVLMMLSEFGCISNCPADITGDGAVTVDDFLVLLGAFGNNC